jgi:cytochrome c-type biogenesis protein CcmH
MMIFRFRMVAVLFGLMAGLLWTGSLLAQEPVTDNDVNDVAKDLFCPVCENVPLDVCPTQACADWREVIRGQLAEGQSKRQIIDYFALQYGDRVRAKPAQQGFSLAVWLLPVLAVFAGAFYFSRYLRGLKQNTAVVAPVKTVKPVANANRPVTEEYLARVEEELKKLK